MRRLGIRRSPLNAIEVKNLYKVFGPRPFAAIDMLARGKSRDDVQRETGALPAVIDVSFTIPAGETFVVMGLSGSGKSTLVRCLNLLHTPTAGSVSVFGSDIRALASKDLRSLRSQRMSMVFQHFGLFPHRTVLQNTEWGLEVRKVPAAQRRESAQRALEIVGLAGWEASYPSELSGGMQQRVGLARALATDADILLMDEAFSALDPLIRAEMQELLIGLQQDLEKTIVFVTHDLNEAMLLGDRIAIMKAGRVVQIGTTEEILQNPADDYVQSFVQNVDRSRVLTARAVMEEPIAKILLREGPQAALRRMREYQTSGLLVVDKHRRLIGTTFDDDVVAAIRHGEHSLDSIVSSDVITVGPDTPLADCLIPSAESRLPLAVVEDGKLLGIIPRVTLLTALASDSSSGNGDHASDAPEAAQPTEVRS